jgi:hypothetical protein
VPVQDGPTYDLTARDEANCNYLVTIVSALDPEEYGINIADVRRSRSPPLPRSGPS